VAKRKLFKQVNKRYGYDEQKKALSVDAEVYEKYKEYCEERGLIISKQIENIMRDGLKNKKSKG